MNSHYRGSNGTQVGKIWFFSILCLLSTLPIARISSAAQPQPALVQHEATPSVETGQSGNSANDRSAAPAPTPERMTPKQALWKLFKFALTGAVLLMLVFGLTIKLIGWFFQGRAKLSATRGRIVAIFGAAIVIPLLLHFSCGSEVRVLRSWELQPSAIKEYNYWATFFFDLPANRYSVNVRGKVTDLHLERAKFESLAQLPGIERLTSLETLEIVETPLVGTIDLSGYTELKELRLQDTKLQTLKGVERLGELQTLDLSHNQLEQIETAPVAGVADLSVLGMLPNLNSLNLSGWDLSRVTGFEHLSRISRLDLSHCTSVDLRIVEHLPQLDDLTLDHSDVVDLKPLTQFERLRVLSIAHTQVRDVTALKNLRIQTLAIGETGLDPKVVAGIVRRDVGVVNFDREMKSFWMIVLPQRRNLLRGSLMALLLFSGLLFLPVPRYLRKTSVLAARRIARQAFGGMFFAWIVVLFYNFNVTASGGNALALVTMFTTKVWAWGAVVLWLIVRPSLLILLETRAFNATPWGSLAQKLTRLVPWLVFGGFFSLVLAPSFAVLLWMFRWYSVLVFAPGWLMFLLIFLVNLINPPPRLRKEGKELTIVALMRQFRWQLPAWATIPLSVFIIYPSLPWLSIIRSVAFWKEDLRSLQRLFTESGTTKATVEIPLHAPQQRALWRDMWRRILPLYFLEPEEKSNYSAHSVGMLIKAPVEPAARFNLNGAVVLIQQRQLARAALHKSPIKP